MSGEVSEARLREALAALDAAIDNPAEAIGRLNRDYLGRLVRETWIKWAEKQPDPKPTWLVSYDRLNEPDKEVDRQIGVDLARIGASTWVVDNRFHLRALIEAALSAPTKGEADLEAMFRHGSDGTVAPPPTERLADVTVEQVDRDDYDSAFDWLVQTSQEERLKRGLCTDDSYSKAAALVAIARHRLAGEMSAPAERKPLPCRAAKLAAASWATSTRTPA